MDEHFDQFTFEGLPLFLCDLKSIVDLPTSTACYKKPPETIKIQFTSGLLTGPSHWPSHLQTSIAWYNVLYVIKCPPPWIITPVKNRAISASESHNNP